MFECLEIPLGGDTLLCAFDGNRLHDALALGDGALDIGAIYLAKVERQMKGLGGVFVALGTGQKGFWRVKNPPREGALVPLQIVQTAMQGKPPRLSENLDFKGAFTILTPGRAGLNVSRKWSGAMDEGLRAELEAALPQDCGAIIRSEAEYATPEALTADFAARIADYHTVQKARGEPAASLILPAPTGRDRANLEWGQVMWAPSLRHDHLDAIHDALALPRKAAGGDVTIESTQALIAIDIDTGSNTAPSAGKDVNSRAAPAIASWLKLMGWGGQLLVDPAPMPMQARKGFEGMMTKAAKAAGLSLTARGFGPLGLFEGQIRYERRPLPADILAQLDGIKIKG